MVEKSFSVKRNRECRVCKKLSYIDAFYMCVDTYTDRAVIHRKVLYRGEMSPESTRYCDVLQTALSARALSFVISGRAVATQIRWHTYCSFKERAAGFS